MYGAYGGSEHPQWIRPAAVQVWKGVWSIWQVRASSVDTAGCRPSVGGCMEHMVGRHGGVTGAAVWQALRPATTVRVAATLTRCGQPVDDVERVVGGSLTKQGAAHASRRAWRNGGGWKGVHPGQKEMRHASKRRCGSIQWRRPQRRV
eukprot:354015-Chlamydomonas_euryale.AAC.2